MGKYLFKQRPELWSGSVLLLLAIADQQQVLSARDTDDHSVQEKT